MKSILQINEKDHVKGKEDSPITFVEYGDFECPYCRAAYPIVNKILKAKGKEIKFVFRNFPLSESHPHAFRSACAVEAASKQGKFWDMYELLFETNKDLVDNTLLTYAKKINLDVDQFTKCLESPDTAKTVKDQFMGGVRIGVNATPTFFINGVRYDGAHDFDSLMEALESINY